MPRSTTTPLASPPTAIKNASGLNVCMLGAYATENGGFVFGAVLAVCVCVHVLRGLGYV
jgi:hypothetical protein